jgi:hypothetical protein
MFAFVNTYAPFRDLKVMGDTLEGLIFLRRHVHVLEFAVKVQWDSRGKLWCLPSSQLDVVGQSFQFMVSVLQKSTCLRTLQLNCVNVDPFHQPLILSIPTLKELILKNTHFIPTVIKVPRSSITSLSLSHGASSRRECVEHTLKLLTNTLETLEVDHVYSKWPLLRDMAQLPRLSTLRLWEADASRFEWFRPHFSTSITKLHITTDYLPYPLGLSDSQFPYLRELSSPWWIGGQFVPRRPVQIFYGTEGNKIGLKELQTNLALFSQSTRGIVELRLYTLLPMPRLLQLLATHIPRLQRLHLCTSNGSLTTAYLELLLRTRPPTETNLSALTGIHISLRGYRLGLRKPICRVFAILGSWICPALETAEVSIGNIEAGFRAQRVIPFQQNFRFHRTPMGEWEQA